MLFKKEDLDKLPALYEQDGKGDKAKVYVVVKLQGYLWLLTEYSADEGLFFGYACLDDPEMAELGYISKKELEDLSKQYIAMFSQGVDMTLAEAKKKYIEEGEY